MNLAQIKVLVLVTPGMVLILPMTSSQSTS